MGAILFNFSNNRRKRVPFLHLPFLSKNVEVNTKKDKFLSTSLLNFECLHRPTQQKDIDDVLLNQFQKTITGGLIWQFQQSQSCNILPSLTSNVRLYTNDILRLPQTILVSVWLTPSFHFESRLEMPFSDIQESLDIRSRCLSLIMEKRSSQQQLHQTGNLIPSIIDISTGPETSDFLSTLLLDSITASDNLSIAVKYQLQHVDLPFEVVTPHVVECLSHNAQINFGMRNMSNDYLQSFGKDEVVERYSNTTKNIRSTSLDRSGTSSRCFSIDTRLQAILHMEDKDTPQLEIISSRAHDAPHNYVQQLIQELKRRNKNSFSNGFAIQEKILNHLNEDDMDTTRYQLVDCCPLFSTREMLKESKKEKTQLLNTFVQIEGEEATAHKITRTEDVKTTRRMISVGDTSLKNIKGRKSSPTNIISVEDSFVEENEKEETGSSTKITIKNIPPGDYGRNDQLLDGDAPKYGGLGKPFTLQKEKKTQEVNESAKTTAVDATFASALLSVLNKVNKDFETAVIDEGFNLMDTAAIEVNVKASNIFSKHWVNGQRTSRTIQEISARLASRNFNKIGQLVDCSDAIYEEFYNWMRSLQQCIRCLMTTLESQLDSFSNKSFGCSELTFQQYLSQLMSLNVPLLPPRYRKSSLPYSQIHEKDMSNADKGHLQSSCAYVLKHVVTMYFILMDEGCSATLAYIISLIQPDTQNSLFLCYLTAIGVPSVRIALFDFFDSICRTRLGIDFITCLGSLENLPSVSPSFNIFVFKDIPVFSPSPLPNMLETPKIEYLLALVLIVSQRRQRLLVLVSGDALIHQLSSILQQRMLDLEWISSYPVAGLSSKGVASIDIFYSGDSLDKCSSAVFTSPLTIMNPCSLVSINQAQLRLPHDLFVVAFNTIDPSMTQIISHSIHLHLHLPHMLERNNINADMNPEDVVDTSHFSVLVGPEIFTKQEFLFMLENHHLSCTEVERTGLGNPHMIVNPFCCLFIFENNNVHMINNLRFASSFYSLVFFICIGFCPPVVSFKITKPTLFNNLSLPKTITNGLILIPQFSFGEVIPIVVNSWNDAGANIYRICQCVNRQWTSLTHNLKSNAHGNWFDSLQLSHFLKTSEVVQAPFERKESTFIQENFSNIPASVTPGLLLVRFMIKKNLLHKNRVKDLIDQEFMSRSVSSEETIRVGTFWWLTSATLEHLRAEFKTHSIQNCLLSPEGQLSPITLQADTRCLRNLFQIGNNTKRSNLSLRETPMNAHESLHSDQHHPIQPPEFQELFPKQKKQRLFAQSPLNWSPLSNRKVTNNDFQAYQTTACNNTVIHCSNGDISNHSSHQHESYKIKYKFKEHQPAIQFDYKNGFRSTSFNSCSTDKRQIQATTFRTNRLPTSFRKIDSPGIARFAFNHKSPTISIITEAERNEKEQMSGIQTPSDRIERLLSRQRWQRKLYVNRAGSLDYETQKRGWSRMNNAVKKRDTTTFGTRKTCQSKISLQRSATTNGQWIGEVGCTTITSQSGVIRENREVGTILQYRRRGSYQEKNNSVAARKTTRMQEIENCGTKVTKHPSLQDWFRERSRGRISCDKTSGQTRIIFKPI